MKKYLLPVFWIVTLACADAKVILNEYNAVRADRWLDADGAAASSAQDTYFGRIQGNGGRWFEVLVVGETGLPGETVDMRGWTFEWTDGEEPDVVSGSFTLTEDSFWASIQRGTIITLIQEDAAGPVVPTDISFNPGANDWWININVEDSQYVVEGGDLFTGNDDWQVTILDSENVQIFQGGEGIGLSGINSREVGKLEAYTAVDPNNTRTNYQQIASTADANYEDGTSSSFGSLNTWSGGANVQNVDVLRDTGVDFLLSWKNGAGGSGVWTPAGGTDWGGGSWNSERIAVFAGSAGAVTLDDSISALGTRFEVDGYSLNGGQLALASSVDVSSGATATINTQLSGTSGLQKSGAGSLVIGGANTFSGNVVITLGTLTLNSAAAVPETARVSVQSGSTFNSGGFDITIAGLGGFGTTNLGAGQLTISGGGGNAARGAITGTASIVIEGGEGENQRFLNVEKTYSGATIINSGNLRVAREGMPINTSAIQINGGELTLTTADAFYSFAPLFGSPAPITMNGGTLGNESGESVFPTGDFEIAAGGATFSSRGAGDGEDVFDGEIYIGGSISGPGNVAKSGQGILYLEGTNTHLGGWNISNGTVQVESGSSLGTGPLTFTSGDNVRALILNNASQTVSLLDGNVSIDDPETEEVEPAGSATIQIGTAFIVDQAEEDKPEEEAGTRFQGSIAGAGRFEKAGTGLLRLTRGPNTYSGTTTISGGVLELSGPAVPSETSGVFINPGGQLRFTSGNDDENNPTTLLMGNAATIELNSTGRTGVTEDAGLGISGGIRYQPGSGENTLILQNDIEVAGDSGLHVSGAGSTLELTGVISGSGALVQSGGGTLVWPTAVSSWTGDLSVSNGTLLLRTGSVGSAGKSITANGGMLQGDGTLVGAVTIGDGGAISPDFAVTEASVLSVDGSLTFEEGSSAVLDLSSEANDLVQVTGDLSFTGPTVVAFLFSSFPESAVIFTATGNVSGVENLSAFFESNEVEVFFTVDGNSVVAHFEENSPTPFEEFMAGFDVFGDDALLFADANGDGIANILKFYLGADPTKFANTVTELGSDGAAFYFTHTINKDFSGVEGVYEWSLDLAEWFTADAVSGGISVNFATSIVENPDESFNTVEVTATIEVEADVELPESLFLRLEAVEPTPL